MEFGARWKYRDDEGTALGVGQYSVNQMCLKLADSELLTADLRGNVTLTERGHAFAEWLATSGYKVNHFWSNYGAWGTQARPFETMEDWQAQQKQKPRL